MAKFVRVTPRVPVADLRRTIDFYTRMLNFHVEILWPHERPTFCIVGRDQTALGFHESAAVGGGEFYIEVEDVRGLHEAVKGFLAIEWGPEVYFYGRREFAVRDPDGYLIVFTEPTDDPPTCGEG